MDAAWAAVSLAFLVPLTGAVWRFGSKIGRIAEGLVFLAKSVNEIKHRQDEHDAWHLRRLERGKDDT